MHQLLIFFFMMCALVHPVSFNDMLASRAIGALPNFPTPTLCFSLWKIGGDSFVGRSRIGECLRGIGSPRMLALQPASDWAPSLCHAISRRWGDRMSVGRPGLLIVQHPRRLAAGLRRLSPTYKGLLTEERKRSSFVWTRISTSHLCQGVIA